MIIASIILLIKTSQRYFNTSFTYVMSLPPLSLGGFQDNVTLDEVISSYSSGPSGGPGRSAQK
jgi:hypothetical protein